MKKYFITSSILIILVLATPHVALAAWWNPFTWFQKAPVAVVTPTGETIQKIISTIPSVTPPPISEPASSTGKIIPKKTIVVPSGKIVSPVTQKGVTTTSLPLPQPTAIVSQTVTPPPAPLTGVQLYLQNLQSEYANGQLGTHPSPTPTPVAAPQPENSSECIAAKAAYDSIEQQIANNLAQEKNATLGSSESRTLASEGADLAIKSQPIADKYYAVCENYYPTPKPMTICNLYGNTVVCQ